MTLLLFCTSKKENLRLFKEVWTFLAKQSIVVKLKQLNYTLFFRTRLAIHATKCHLRLRKKKKKLIAKKSSMQVIVKWWEVLLPRWCCWWRGPPAGSWWWWSQIAGRRRRPARPRQNDAIPQQWRHFIFLTYLYWKFYILSTFLRTETVCVGWDSNSSVSLPL